MSGRQVTSRQAEMFGTRSYGREKHWEREIKELMEGFCVPSNVIKTVITETKEEQTEFDTNKTMYCKAWEKFKDTFKAFY